MISDSLSCRHTGRVHGMPLLVCYIAMMPVDLVVISERSHMNMYFLSRIRGSRGETVMSCHLHKFHSLAMP